MQTFVYLKRDKVLERQLPPCDEEIVPGVVWGRVDQLFTVAYWLGQYWLSGVNYFFSLTTIISPDQRQLLFDS